MSQFTSLIRAAQLESTLARVRRLVQAGEPVPFKWKLILALAQNRLPDPDVDKRTLVDSRGQRVRKGRRAPRRSTAERRSKHEKPDRWRSRIAYIVEEFAADKLSLKRPAYPLVESPAGPLMVTPAPPGAPARMSVRERRRAWAKRDRPDKVTAADWELLQLVEVEGMKVPAIAKFPAYQGTRAEALRQRIARVRKAAGLIKLAK